MLVGYAYLGQDLGHRNARVDWQLTVYNQQIATPTAQRRARRARPVT